MTDSLLQQCTSTENLQISSQAPVPMSAEEAFEEDGAFL